MATNHTDKKPFNIPQMLRKIRAAVRPFPKAAMFELYDKGHRTLFEQLVACIISIRTRDEVSEPTARKLFEKARTPEGISRLPVSKIDELIRAATYHEQKAHQIKSIAQRIVKEFDGDLPCDFDVLTSFSGVGPKCANLALGIACGQPRIAVDIHVHRVTNRWGYVHTRTPEETMAELEKVLPKRYWIEINRLLVPFGKHICTGTLPHCSTCPVLEYCRQVGVTAHR
jgi:endonuclease-3